MVYLFYNKILLRVLVLLAGVGVGIAAYHYIALSAEKLPEQGAFFALQIISFMIAGWLVMLIAEVVDNHYVRVFGTLCMGLGAFVSYPWIFNRDGPQLMSLPDAPARWPVLSFGFWSAVAVAAILRLLLVTRLIIDKLTYGKPLQKIAAQKTDTDLGQAPQGMGQKAKPGELPPIPVDTSPLAVATVNGGTGSGSVQAAATAPAPPVRILGPVHKLKGVGGLYDGSEFNLAPGRMKIGRQDADIQLENDTQVSRAHAVLVVDEQGMALIEDNGSTNGTFLNNEKVSTAPLAPGDMLRIGTTQFRVEA
jgi:hypothetical protein